MTSSDNLKTTDMDLDKITDKEKAELCIACVSERDLTIRCKWKTIELTKYSDGDVEFEITAGSEHTAYILDKAQIEFLAKWLLNNKKQ